MPLTTYTAGEVLTAASLNDNFGTTVALVKTQTIGTAVSTVTVTGAFSATYDAYKVVIVGGVGSTSANLNFQLGATTSAYYGGRFFVNSSTAATSAAAVNNAANFTGFGGMTANGVFLDLNINAPFLSTRTQVWGVYGLSGAGDYGWLSGNQDSATSFTAFTVATASGTITGGEIRVYGYANS
jgi:hypothetical protein